MDTVFAVKYSTGAILAVETTINHSIFKLKKGADKTFQLDSHSLMSLSGDIADRAHFGSFIQRNVDFFRFKNGGKRSSVKRSSQFIRSELAKALRKGMKQVSPMIVGYDERKKAQLYWMDYLGTIAEVNYGSQGYAAYFATSILANAWRENMEQEEAMELIHKCINQLKGRMIISQESFDFWIADKDGIRKLETLSE